MRGKKKDWKFGNDRVDGGWEERTLDCGRLIERAKKGGNNAEKMDKK